MREGIAKYMSPVPHTIGPDEALSSANRSMRRYEVRHLPVVKDGRLVGVISERDVLWADRFAPDSLTVREAMSPNVYSVNPQTPAHRVVHEMARQKYGSAVVVEAGQVVGIFTTTDALRALGDLLEDQDPAIAEALG